MGFSYDKHSVLKILETFCTSDLPVQRTPYSMDLFDASTDPTLVDQPSYLALKAPQLAVIMACSHNAEPTQGDLVKGIRLLAYLKGTPTWLTK
jgi:hypothetical protein